MKVANETLADWIGRHRASHEYSNSPYGHICDNECMANAVRIFYERYGGDKAVKMHDTLDYLARHGTGTDRDLARRVLDEVEKEDHV